MPEFSNNVEGLILIIGGLVVFLNQGLALARKYVEEALDRRRGNGTTGAVHKVERAVHELREEIRDRAPLALCNIQPDQVRQLRDVERVVIAIDARLSSWQTAVDKGDFGCRVRGSHLRTLERVEDRIAKGDRL